MNGELWALALEAFNRLPEQERTRFSQATWMAGFVAGAYKFDPDNARELDCQGCEEERRAQV